LSVALSATSRGATALALFVVAIIVSIGAGVIGRRYSTGLTVPRVLAGLVVGVVSLTAAGHLWRQADRVDVYLPPSYISTSATSASASAAPGLFYNGSQV